MFLVRNISQQKLVWFCNTSQRILRPRRTPFSSSTIRCLAVDNSPDIESQRVSSTTRCSRILSMRLDFWEWITNDSTLWKKSRLRQDNLRSLVYNKVTSRIKSVLEARASVASLVQRCAVTNWIVNASVDLKMDQKDWVWGRHAWARRNDKNTNKSRHNIQQTNTNSPQPKLTKLTINTYQSNRH